MPSEIDPALGDYLPRFGLPAELAGRDYEITERVEGLWDYHRRQVEDEGRRFHLGLMVAFVAITEAICKRLGEQSVPNALTRFPPLETRGGRRLNTLTMPVPGGREIGLRGFYNKVEQTIRFWLARRAYPSMAPHATQAWAQHAWELEEILGMSPEERAGFVRLLWDEILEIPRPAYRSSAEARPRPFVILLQDFTTSAGEPAGVVLQSLAYAFFKVQLGHLTAVESGKVRAGGARTGNVGDIDGWDAAELVETIEVKDLDLTAENEPELAGFLDNLTDWPDATAIVVANSFFEDLEARLEEQNVLAMTREDLIQDARAWDMERQRKAVRSMDYYIVRVQGHPGLTERFREFLIENNISLE